MPFTRYGVNCRRKSVISGFDLYGEYSAESAWREFGDSYCKVRKGFISGKGEFYEDVLDVPRFHNLMTVFKVG